MVSQEEGFFKATLETVGKSLWQIGKKGGC